ncbi:Aspartyl protease [Pustulibacterium marinum]|uniref:Aspartyl protease n=1 Tax=Pustulibacterium marinum TaxID=1224947 RepID=A0A1I7HPQ9_9FLAO|nr:aspartyl protease family protein [Pustulibacterium marinum]SFU62416.1 Aspartyl protease [Pustulibacterium marinum]
MKNLRIILFLVFISAFVNAQNFEFTSNKKYEEMSFTSVGNLIFIPVIVNGVPLNFVLDSGVNKSVVLNLSGKDSLKFDHQEEIYLKGLGKKEPFIAIHSKHNEMHIGNLLDLDHEIFIVLDEEINFSKRLGVTVHGIIGFDLLKDFVVQINYDKKKLRFYPYENYKKKKLGKRETEIPLVFKNSKPYVNLRVELNNEFRDIDVLLDTGNSDAIWLFKNDSLSVPERNFEDFLGKGLSGEIHGKRSKVNSLLLNDFELKEVKCAFPDEEYFSFAKKYEERDGSIGGEVLSRFQVTFNYRDMWLRLKKSNKFRKDFYYNMSGIRLGHNGVKIIEEKKGDRSNQFIEKGSKGFTVFFQEQLKYRLADALEIVELRAGSPAAEAGLRVGDVILFVNRTLIEGQSMEQVHQLMNTIAGRKIRVVVDRRGEVLKFKFVLQKVL